MAVSASLYAQDTLPLQTGRETGSQQNEVVTEQVETQAQRSVRSLLQVAEEMLVYGRLRSTASSIIDERRDKSVAVDIIGIDAIDRAGDSTVAIALQRLPGVTLVNDKYVYVRGLGERYLNTTLNGAVVPSPDLTRNVIPLDIFPTSIVKSLAIQKVSSANMSAAFGGGNVDIRTTGTPEDLLFSFELSTGLNTEGSGGFITYNGGGQDDFGTDDGTRELSPLIRSAVGTYRANFNPMNIESIDDITREQANAVNRNLAMELYRDISIEDKSNSPDLGAEVNFGNVFNIGGGIQLGFLAGVFYDQGWRNKDSVSRKFSAPNEQVSFIRESDYSVDITGNFSLGLILNDENRIDTTNIYLRNTDDEVRVNNFFNANDQLSSGRGQRYTEYQYEERNLMVNQIHGTHEFGSTTIAQLGLGQLSFLEGLSFDWYYSDSEATTDIPSALRVISFTTADPVTGETITSTVGSDDRNSAQYRFSDLNDYVESYGWKLAYPFELGSMYIKLTAGNEYWEKVRYFEQLRFNLGSRAQGNTAVFSGPLGGIYADQNIQDERLGFEIRVQDATSSYLAANKVISNYGLVDITWDDSFRAVAGLRQEDYQQVNLGWNPNEFTGSPLVGLTQAFNALSRNESLDSNPVSDFFEDATFIDTDTYGSLALTYMTTDFWAEDFQLRFNYAETTVRPDIREIANSSYTDPITDISVNGNPDVRPSLLKNYDLRAEWFFENGDNFTLSAFYKDITNPIELFEAAATDDNIAAKIQNADSAEIAGIELEFLKSLGGFSNALEPFYIQGNFTLLDHELIVGNRADAPTNLVRGLQGASDYAANLMIGFDADNGKHAATFVYNVFGERLFFAGRNGAPDTFEQPFHSLNLVYSYYPFDNLTIKVKGKNLLNESLNIERTLTQSDGSKQDVVIRSENVGVSFNLSVKYEF